MCVREREYYQRERKREKRKESECVNVCVCERGILSVRKKERIGFRV